MGGSALSTSAGTGGLVADQIQGNPGDFIIVMWRTRMDSDWDPKIITRSLWQIVRAVPGTWLTAVAAFGLHWPKELQHRVYWQEWVEPCKPLEADDTIPHYNFFYFQEGGGWEDGVTGKNPPPNPLGPRDVQIDVGSYWAFKLSETVIEMPDLSGDEVLQHRKKILDFLFEKAMIDRDKQALLDKLNKFEKDAEALGKSKKSEEEKRQELKKMQAELQEKVRKTVIDPEVIEAIEGWYSFFERALDRSLELKEKQEERVKKEIQYMKFRLAQYNHAHEGKQGLEKVQKGTDEEHQWKKTPSLRRLPGPPWTPSPYIAPSPAGPTPGPLLGPSVPVS